MVHIPDRVRATPTVARGKNWAAWYRPANTRRDLPRGVRTGAMDDFLMSGRVQDVSDSAAEDIIDEAKQIAVSEGMVSSGQYVSSFDKEPVLVTASDDHPNPRRGAHVVNDAGDPETGFSTVAAMEFGNAVAKPRRVMARAGAKFDSPKDGVE